VRVSDFHFDLPEELIAQIPPAVRGTSRMLVLDRESGTYTDERFTDLPTHLRPGDLLILNDSRVLPARLFATRAGLHTQHNSPDPTGRIEVLLTQQLEPDTWSALVRPSRKVQPGEHLHFRDESAPPDIPPDTPPLLAAEVLTAGEFGERTLRFSPVANFYEILDRIGHMPLPPYIHRSKESPDTPEDKTRYQTVYSRERGSAAAPTAGLHFTPEMLDQLRHKGVQIETITLHVGLGTFQPVRVEHLADIRLHAEHYTLPASTTAAINAARAEGRRIIAAGTTTTRTLEHCALEAHCAPEAHCASEAHCATDAERTGQINLAPHSGQTSIFLSPGHNFRVVSGLLTNFHLPESTLLMLVSAFADPEQGREVVLRAYAHAVQQKYRFFSYGDCMLLL
jgi:S-adenosylmethionine:tRNA ribosyltransferase-isomerase